MACAALGGGCFAPNAVTCPDGRVCPPTKVCAPAGGCVDPEQLAACEGRAPSAMCSTGAVPNGACRDGVCTLVGCGNGVLDPGEICDDHNTTSGDGCPADCSKLELCGDTITDANEDCDDGNHNPADGCDECRTTTWTTNRLTGASTVGALTPISPVGIAADRHGHIFIADRTRNRVSRADVATGTLTILAGSPLGVSGFAGDGGPAANALLTTPSSITVDGLDNVYIADTENQRIRKIDGVTGVITTVVGSGKQGFTGDGGPATGATLDTPVAVAIDGLGNLFVGDSKNNRVRRVDWSTGIIATFAGTGEVGSNGDGGLATLAQLNGVNGLTVDGAGRVYIADADGFRIRRVDPTTMVIETLIGTGVGGFAGDGGPATAAQINLYAGSTGPARLPVSIGLAIDASGSLYFADCGNQRIRRVDAITGIVNTVVGTGVRGLQGDGGPATDAMLTLPQGVSFDPLGNLYIGDGSNRRVRRVSTSGTIETVVGKQDMLDVGDGRAATSVDLTVSAIALDPAGNLYVADNEAARVRRIAAATGVASTIAGNGVRGHSGDGGPAIAAQLTGLFAMVFDGFGNLYIAESEANQVRRVAAASGIITPFAGTGTPGYSGDGGPATGAQLFTPLALAVDSANNVYIGDHDNRRIRKVDAATGIISTVVGMGTFGDSGDGGLATNAQISSVTGITLDPGGNLYFSDDAACRVRMVAAATGIIQSVAGTGVAGSGGDGGLATAAQVTPRSVARDPLGNLYIVEGDVNSIRRIDAVTGGITTFAGGPGGELGGDGGSAAMCSFQRPTHLTLAANGDLVIGDTSWVRKITASTGIVTTVAGPIWPGGMGPSLDGYLTDPRAVAWAPPYSFIAGGQSGTVQARNDAGRLDVVAGRYPQPAPSVSLARFRDRSFGSVAGIAWDGPSRRIYLAETSANRLHAVTVVDENNPDTWTITPFGNVEGALGYADGAAATARFRQPAGLFFDETSRLLYVADTGNHVIRVIDTSQGLASATVTTIAGTPQTRGDFGDGGPANAGGLYQPQAVTRCGNGDLFIADTGNHRVRRIEAATGLLTTVLGDGVGASSGQGAPARSFPVDTPRGIACDALGNVFVTSSSTVRLLPSRDGVVDGEGAVLTPYPLPSPTGLPETRCLSGIAVIDARTVRLTDSCAGVMFDLQRKLP